MSGGDHPPPSDDFDERLRSLKGRRERDREKEKGRGRNSGVGGLGFALRIGTELVAAVGIGVGIGLLLDRWLGTTPWLMIVFFLFGCAAGMLNVFRSVSGFGYGSGYRRPGRDEGPDGKRGEE